MTHGRDQRSAEAAASRAADLEQAGRPAEALQVLGDAISAGADEPGLWHNRGLLFMALHEWEPAIESFSEAIRRGYASHTSRGVAYERMGESQTARQDYREVLKREPGDLDATVNLGTLELEEGNLTEALRLLVSAAAVDPRANWQLADVLVALGRGDDALDALGIAIGAGENRAHLDRALLTADTATVDDVAADFDAAVEAGATGARREYAVFLDRHGLPERGLDIAQQGIAAGDDLCFAPAAVIAEELGEIALAVQYYRSAIENGDREYESDLEALLERGVG